MNLPTAASRAQERARALRQEGKLREAALYQINALGHEPSGSLLEEHAAVVFALSEQCQQAGDTTEARLLLEELNGRLASFLERVDPEDVEQVRHLSRTVEEHLAPRPAPTTTEASPPDPETARLVSMAATLVSNRWDWSVPQAPEATLARLQEVAALADFLAGDDYPVAPSLQEQLVAQREALRRAASSDEGCQEAGNAVQEAAAEKDFRVGLALLQQAEASLRGLLPGVRRLDQERQHEVLQQLDRITEALSKVQTAQAAERSKRRWAAALTALEADMTAARAWRYAYPGDCQTQLARLQRISESASEALRELDDPTTRRDAMTWLHEVAQLGQHTSAKQRDAYNEWALERTRIGFTKALPHIKVTGNDEEAMDRELQDALDPISTAFLSAEVSRAYSEVLEYFLAKLYAPGKDKGFDKEGARLHLLKRLARATKKTPSDF